MKNYTIIRAALLAALLLSLAASAQATVTLYHNCGGGKGCGLAGPSNPINSQYWACGDIKGTVQVINEVQVTQKFSTLGGVDQVTVAGFMCAPDTDRVIWKYKKNNAADVEIYSNLLDGSDMLRISQRAGHGSAAPNSGESYWYGFSADADPHRVYWMYYNRDTMEEGYYCGDIDSGFKGLVSDLADHSKSQDVLSFTVSDNTASWRFQPGYLLHNASVQFCGGAPAPVNGACGATNNACTAGTLNDIADSATQYLWQCVGSNGGTTASCSLNKPVNGACGAANNACTAGTLSDIADNSTHYLWQCVGQNGGTTASCSATRAAIPVNGVCGAANNVCTAGTLNDIADNSTHYLWQCMGQNGGTNSPVCSLRKSVNGACGAANNACTSGTLNDIADSATQYLWQCVGSNGGTTASCSLNKAINGVCGATNNACTAGTLNDITDSATQYLWQCVSSNGGTTASCELTKGCKDGVKFKVAGVLNTYCCGVKDDICPPDFENGPGGAQVECPSGDPDCGLMCTTFNDWRTADVGHTSCVVTAPDNRQFPQNTTCVRRSDNNIQLGVPYDQQCNKSSMQVINITTIIGTRWTPAT